MINKKLKAVIKAKLRPILCIGETEKERKKGKTFQVLKSQIKKALSGISSFTVHRSKFIFAYEPVWAIGTGNPCQPKEAKEVLEFLRKKLKNIPILYGGSVNSKNAKDYIEVGFNGLLVGGASLNPKEFIEIVKSCA
jgi:triosephosphate isomerase